MLIKRVIFTLNDFSALILVGVWIIFKNVCKTLTFSLTMVFYLFVGSIVLCFTYSQKRHNKKNRYYFRNFVRICEITNMLISENFLGYLWNLCWFFWFPLYAYIFIDLGGLNKYLHLMYRGATYCRRDGVTFRIPTATQQKLNISHAILYK